MAVLSFLLAIACCYDYGSGRIPNLLLLGITAVGITRSLFGGGSAGGIAFLAAAAAVTALWYPLFKIGTVGAGDVKLLGVCAGYFSIGKIIYFLFFSMLAAAIFSLIKLWKNKNFKERFLYLREYAAEVARTGNWRLYLKDEGEKRTAGLCLSGPILISVLMHWGGVY